MNDKFNDEIKHAFDALEDDINPELIWKGINSKIATSKKKKKRFLVWWFFGITSGLTLLVLFFTIDNKKEIVGEAIVDVENEVLIEDSSIKKDIGDIKFEAEAVVEGSDVNKIALRNNEPNLPGKSSKKQKNVFVNSSTHIDSKFVENAVEVNPTQDPKTYKGSIDQPNVQVSLLDEIDSHDILTDNREKVSSISPLENRFITSLMTTSPQVELFKTPNPSLIKVNNANSFSLIKSLEFYSGLSVGNKTILSSITEYDLKRNELERLLEEIHLGIRFQMVRAFNFSLYSGLKYSRVNDSWQMNLSYNEDRPVTFIDYKVEFGDGTVENHYTTEYLDHEINRYIEQYNTEQILSFPIELRYEKRINNWSFSSGAGLEFAYLFGAKHKVLGLDDLPTIHSRDGGWLSPNVCASLSLAYRVSPQWFVSGNFTYRQLSIKTNSIIPDLSANYKLLGMELGVTRILN